MKRIYQEGGEADGGQAAAMAAPRFASSARSDEPRAGLTQPVREAAS